MNSVDYIKLKLEDHLIGPEYIELLREILTDEQAAIIIMKDVDGFTASEIDDRTGNVYGTKLIQELINYVDDYLKIEEPIDITKIALYRADSTRRFQNLDINEITKEMMK